MEFTNIPTHISMIMDGNGRWAKSRGKERWEGHYAGVESVRCALTECGRLGVKYLSLYAFSEENWNRSGAEVEALMELMLNAMLKEVDLMLSKNVRFMVLGNRARLSDSLNAVIDECMSRTASNTGITFILFISYSGRWDIAQATARIAAAVADGTLSPESVSADTVSSYLVTAGIPDPDLIIRTSGEQRISNYLLWQSAYSEFWFTDVLWPDFREEQLHQAIAEYSKRDRRYGKTK